MKRFQIRNDYFEWMFDLVCTNRYAEENSYRELLSYLHEVEFTYTIRNDCDRACDGISLRHRFALLHEEYNYNYILDCLGGPCSVLEMMIALAIRCEEEIMTNPKVGDRTSQWFWKMIVNLGLGAMSDNRFDADYVKDIIDKFLHREYESDGHGGLFILKGCEYDLRSVDIWSQLCYFLDTMI